MKSKAFDPLRPVKLVETTAEDFLKILAIDKVSIVHYLKRLHNLALGLGWLAFPVLAPPALAETALQGQTRHRAGRTSAHSCRREEPGAQSVLSVALGNRLITERRRPAHGGEYRLANAQSYLFSDENRRGRRSSSLAKTWPLFWSSCQKPAYCLRRWRRPPTTRVPPSFTADARCLAFKACHWLRQRRWLERG